MSFINSYTMSLEGLDGSSKDLYTGDHIDTTSVVHMKFFLSWGLVGILGVIGKATLAKNSPRTTGHS